MRHRLLLITLALLLVAAAARAAPAAPTRSAWATGRLVGVNTAARTLEIRQGNRELPFTVTPRARIVRGTTPLRVTDLEHDLGHRVRLRYTATPAARLVDLVEVLGAVTPAGH